MTLSESARLKTRLIVFTFYRMMDASSFPVLTIVDDYNLKFINYIRVTNATLFDVGLNG